MTNPSTRQKGQACVTNSQAADYDSWPVRCSRRALGLAEAISITTFMFWKNNIGKGGLKNFFFKGEGGQRRGDYFKRRG